jgi:DNA-directed RNA polymerase specialized sigma24 family protein
MLEPKNPQEPTTLLSLLPAAAATPGAFAPPASAALNRRILRTLRSYEWLCLRKGLRDADLDDAKQEIALRAWLVVCDPDQKPVGRPTAFCKSLAKNVVSDQLRRQQRHPPARYGDLLDAMAGPSVAPDYESVLHRIERHVREYVDMVAANAGSRASRAAEQILAWYRLRVVGVAASAVAEELGVTPSKAALIWKWAERGRALVSDFARRDPVGHRATMMLRLAEASDRQAA